jgi:hypothetical protein
MSATRAVPALVAAALAQVARLRMAPSPEHAFPRNIGPAESGTGALEKALQQM